MYFSIFSSWRARRSMFGVLENIATLSGSPSALKKSLGLYPSGKRGLNQRVPLRGVAGMGEGNAGGSEG